jgi:hypothetical protein
MHGVRLTWSGRVTFLSACTPAIDTFTVHTNVLGTRWLYYRVPRVAIEKSLKVARMASDRRQVAAARAGAQGIAGQIVVDARDRVRHVVVSDEMSELISACAVFVGLGRVNVERDHSTGYEIGNVPDVEGPGRTAHQLQLLARSLYALELSDDQVARIVRHTAVSSMPGIRGEAMRTVMRSGVPVSRYQIMRDLRTSQRAAYRTMEELEAAGLLMSAQYSEIPSAENLLFSPSEEAARILEAVFGSEAP